MRKADFTARIKKIEIVNRVLTDGWHQSIRVILEEIDLSDSNLLELKQFRPSEQVLVELSPVQVNLFDCGPGQRAAGSVATTAPVRPAGVAKTTATAGTTAITGMAGNAEVAATAIITEMAETTAEVTAGITGTARETETALLGGIAGNAGRDRQELVVPGQDDTAEFLSFTEGDSPLQSNEQVVKEWKFESSR